MSDEVRETELGGGSLPPILNLTNPEGTPGAMMKGEFLGYRHIEKAEGDARKKGNVRKYEVFNFRVQESNIEGVALGEEYSIFAPGHLFYILSSIAQAPQNFVGKTVEIEYLGKDLIKKGSFKGSPVHRFKAKLIETNPA